MARTLARARALVGVIAVSAASLTLVTSAGDTAHAATPSSRFSATVTAQRTQRVAGLDSVVDKRTISLTVDQTANLRDQQSITVSWSGAHPSANSSTDPNSTASDNAEYPMVLLQCRDVGPASLPAAQRVDPTTCWADLADERLQSSYGAGGSNDIGNFPAWRLDRAATAADRAQFAGLPTPATATCPADGALAARAVPFVAADGTKYYGSGLDRSCGSSPPEALSFSDAGTVSQLPDNATFTKTLVDGTGTYSFNVRDARTNASLGCSATVACSLVAIPVMGISCDSSLYTDPVNPDAPDEATNALHQCEASGQYQPGSTQKPGSEADFAVSGRLWWSASNWQNRIVVPLSFAPTSDACGLNSAKKSVDVYGSELLVQASSQWATALCLNPSATPFTHVQAAEPLARTLVGNGSIEAAFTSYPPDNPYPKPIVQAPVAATGFAVSYTIDDAKGDPVHTLRLTPRLLAKLMTESYPGESFVKKSYTFTDKQGYYNGVNPLAGNPINVTTDPEFIALNPGLPRYGDGDAGVSALLSISSQSDVMYALTSYITADPEARSWLDGTPDPWGMRVNPNYRAIALPVNTWPLLDTWSVPSTVFPPDLQRCETTVQPQPPYLPLIAGPLARLADIAQSVQFAVPGDANTCGVKNDPSTTDFYYFYTRAPKQSFGRRFVIGITSLGDARRYTLDTASLESQSSVDPTAMFSTPAARTFVDPTDDALRRALATSTFDSTSRTWSLSYSGLRSTAADAGAYPGAMLVYAAIPTQGLSAGDAAAYAGLLHYAVTSGQQPGAGVGQLPDGFVPLTAADGLGAQAAYTLEAARDVAAQQGLLPGQSLPVTAHPSPSSTPTAAPSTGPTTGSGGSAAMPAAGGAGAVTAASSATAAPTPSATPTASAPARTSPQLRSLGRTQGLDSPFYQRLLVLVVGLLLIGPIVGPLVWFLSRRQARR